MILFTLLSMKKSTIQFEYKKLWSFIVKKMEDSQFEKIFLKKENLTNVESITETMDAFLQSSKSIEEIWVEEIEKLNKKYEEIEFLLVDIKDKFKSIQQDDNFQNVYIFEEKIKTFELLVDELEEINRINTENWLQYTNNSKCIDFSFQKKILNILIILIKNFENLLHTKLEILDKLMEDKNRCLDFIQQNEKQIDSEKNRITNLLTIKDIDTNNSFLYKDLIKEKQDIIENLKFYNENEISLINTKILFINQEIEQIKSQIKSLSLS